MAIKFVDVTGTPGAKAPKAKEAPAAKSPAKSEGVEQPAPGLLFEKPGAAKARKAAANGEAPAKGKAKQKFGNKKKG